MRRFFAGRKSPRRVLVIGLDCAAPELVLGQFRADLPALSQLAAAGTWGELRSCIPCITVPAWACMLSGRDPGELGVYGFHNRADYSYAPLTSADSRAIRVPRVWDYTADAGKTSVVLGVPPTYPVQPIDGHLVSCFLTPGQGSQFAYPAVFKQEILRVVPDYAFDVRDFRTADKARLLAGIHAQTEQHHRLILHCLKNKPWDFFMAVHIGVDRMHHGFWRYHDPRHRLHEPGSPFAHAIRDYYCRLDAMIGEIITAAPDATILIVSDHGATRMDGGICINEWLWRNGWLALKTPPPSGSLTPLDKVDVDWVNTRAWAAGGYYGRIFLNVAGREPQGMIAPADYDANRDELAALLATIPGPDGEPLHTQVFRPEAIYKAVNGVAPDLLVYFGDLHWRAIGSLGHGAVHTLTNDTGPDDANHAPDGLFILHTPGENGAGQVSGHQLMDVAPTLLSLLGIPRPPEMQGRKIGKT